MLSCFLPFGEDGEGRDTQGASTQQSLCLPGLLLQPRFLPLPGGKDIWKPLKLALGHLQGGAACNPCNPILMNLCAQNQA